MIYVLKNKAVKRICSFLGDEMVRNVLMEVSGYQGEVITEQNMECKALQWELICCVSASAERPGWLGQSAKRGD